MAQRLLALAPEIAGEAEAGRYIAFVDVKINDGRSARLVEGLGSWTPGDR
jgi:hypothetical protein